MTETLKPMETAPKGSLVLAYKGSWKHKWAVVYHAKNAWRVAATGAKVTPTSWLMELPSNIELKEPR